MLSCCLIQTVFCYLFVRLISQSELYLNQTHKQLFFNCVVPLGLLPLGNSGCLIKQSATQSRYPTNGARWVFQCFHNAPSSDCSHNAPSSDCFHNAPSSDRSHDASSSDCFHNAPSSDMVYRLLNVRTDTNAGDCTRGCTDTHKRVCTFRTGKSNLR